MQDLACNSLLYRPRFTAVLGDQNGAELADRDRTCDTKCLYGEQIKFDYRFLITPCQAAVRRVQRDAARADGEAIFIIDKAHAVKILFDVGRHFLPSFAGVLGTENGAAIPDDNCTFGVESLYILEPKPCAGLDLFPIRTGGIGPHDHAVRTDRDADLIGGETHAEQVFGNARYTFAPTRTAIHRSQNGTAIANDPGSLPVVQRDRV